MIIILLVLRLVDLRMGDSDDDTPQLSSHALAALQEFYTEQEAARQLMQQAEQGDATATMVQEDWVGLIFTD